jgi:phosphopantothenoylcysteine decarboxylase/phosphopantothenate--cysteine ligase
MKALVTAGPTYEHIDPVRFIGNHSSGKMGIEIAEELKRRGYDVTLIIGPTHLTCSESINRVDVTSADDMYEACIKEFPSCDVAIMSAAVADYKPSFCSDKKIKRNGDNLTIELIPNKDIASELGKMKKANQKLIGFALETNDGVDNAIRKIISKNLDMIVLNQIGEKGVGFKVDTNKISLIKLKHNFTKANLQTMVSFQDMLKNYRESLLQDPSSTFYNGLVKNTEAQISEWKHLFITTKDFEMKSKSDVAVDIVNSL